MRITADPLPNVTFSRLAWYVRVVLPDCRFWDLISTRPDTPLTRQTLTRTVGSMRRRTYCGAAARRLCLRFLAAVEGGVGVGVGGGVDSHPPSPESPPSLPSANSAPSRTTTSATTATHGGIAGDRRWRREADRGENGSRSWGPGRSKRCLYSSTSIFESSPR